MGVFFGRRRVSTVFGIRRLDENGATAALGWSLSQSPTLMREFLADLFQEPVDGAGVDVRMQRHDAEASGFTDIELRDGSELHVVIEAKAGWTLPLESQLALYAARVDVAATRLHKLVSLTAMDRRFVDIPSSIGRVPTAHRSWEDLVRLARRCSKLSNSHVEKLWLDQLSSHLEGYMQTPDMLSNLVYLTPLNRSEIGAGSGCSSIDISMADPPRYFHPVGGPRRRRYPKVPPNYIGFRYDGKVQSIHFVESVDVVRDLSQVDPRWPSGDDPTFVYTLGPAMRPAKEIRSGDIFAMNAHYCAIDTLLSGRHETVADAVAETQRRQRLMRSEEPASDD